MSQKLVSLNPDLSRLRADGLDIYIGKSKHLFIRGVPYVNAAKEVKLGIIAAIAQTRASPSLWHAQAGQTRSVQ